MESQLNRQSLDMQLSPYRHEHRLNVYVIILIGQFQDKHRHRHGHRVYVNQERNG